jgi:hypothetical protein
MLKESDEKQTAASMVQKEQMPMHLNHPTAMEQGNFEAIKKIRASEKGIHRLAHGHTFLTSLASFMSTSTLWSLTKRESS